MGAFPMFLGLLVIWVMVSKVPIEPAWAWGLVIGLSVMLFLCGVCVSCYRSGYTFDRTDRIMTRWGGIRLPFREIWRWSRKRIPLKGVTKVILIRNDSPVTYELELGPRSIVRFDATFFRRRPAQELAREIARYLRVPLESEERSSGPDSF